MSLRTRRGWGVLASLLFVASACTQGGTPGGAQPTPTGPVGGGGAAASPGGAVNLFGSDYKTAKFKEGQPGGTLIFADWQEANLFNPFYQGQVTEANLAAITFNGLVTTTYDFKYAPDLAAEIPTLDNGGVKAPGDGGDAMTVTWKLLDGLKFSDGEPLGCSDVKFTHGWVMDPQNVGLYAGKSGYEDISSVECRSETDMVWHFKNIYEGYITLFSPSGGTILPEHYASKISIKDIQTGKGYLAAEMAKVPVTGPFKFQSVTPKQEIRLVRNDNFKSSTFHGPPYLDTFVFKWYADADAMIAAYKGGSPEYDVATDLNDPDLPKLTDIQDQVHQLAGLTYEFLRPNWSATTCSPRVADRGRGCPMSDPAMREALKYAIDKNEINRRLLGGNAALAETPYPSQAWFYAEPTDKQAFDPARAKKALDDAGWRPGADGIRSKGGLRAKVELCTTTRQVRQDTLALVSKWLKDVGIESTVNAVSSDDIFATFNESTDQTPCVLARGKFDVALHAFSQPLDPLGAYPVYHSTQVSPKGSNDARVSDPEIDKALEAVKSTVDFSKVKAAMADFQRLYVEKIIEIPIYFRKEVTIVNPKVQNFTGNPSSNGPTWNAADWWIQQ